MPKVEDYHYQHPGAIPEPHVQPGYTGYFPGYGPKRMYQMGNTYGKMTHDIMKIHPMAGRRLAPMVDNSKVMAKTYSEAGKALYREMHTNDVKLRGDLMSGYSGYIPRKIYHYGKTQVPECRESIAEFQDLQQQTAPIEPAIVLPDQKLLGHENEMSAQRPYALNENEDVPSYLTFRQETDYGERPMNMSSLNPNKKHVLGFCGYYPGKPFHHGMTHGKATNSGLEEMSSALEERKILKERPTLEDWYVSQKEKVPQKFPLDGYHTPMIDKVGLMGGAFQKQVISGYGGYVPRYGHKVGMNYHNSARNFCNHEDLTHSVENYSRQKC